MIEVKSVVGIEQLSLAIEVAAGISSLPAVATQDWCIRAAAALRPIKRDGIIAVTLAILGARGTLVQLEATGAIGSDPMGRPLEGEMVHPEHTPSLDWWLEPDLAPPSKTGAAVLRELGCYARWVESSAGRRWQRLGASDLIVGLATMPGSIPGRCLAVEIGGNAEAASSHADVELLRASLGLLARRAVLAFGHERSTALTRLTSREQQVLDHLALGKSVKEIAQDLGRSPHTVHDHVKSLHRKLSASSRGELIARALGHLSTSGPSPAAKNGLAGLSDSNPPTITPLPTLLSA